jgi:protein-disulfide isomerase/uncharacterized membrane protein
MPASANASTAPMTARRFWFGGACLALGFGAAALLAAQELHLFSAPGCGEGSPCARAAASVFGAVPLVGWPTSFAGVAWFAGLAAAWVAARRGGAAGGALRFLAWAGAAASVALLVAMIAGGYVCPYCVAVHVGGFGFLFAVESAPRRGGGGRGLAWFAGAFAAMTAAASGARYAVESAARRDADATSQRIAEESTQPPPEGADPARPFTGRYRLGPANAPIRIVLFADFQCKECRQVEMELRRILAWHRDVSVSMKHFPFNSDCNPTVGVKMHPNACWAARAAEAAGMLRGDEGFRQMHHWLFDRSGSFTDADLKAVLAQFGWDHAEFLKAMSGEEAKRRIEADAREASELGLYFTPLVYINGVEFRSWFVEGNLSRAVAALSAKNLPPGDASLDRPPLSARKHLDDWILQPAVPVAADARAWSEGPAEAPVSVVLWGDYEEPFCREADTRLRRAVAARSDARYTFRHYPILSECNPGLPADAINIHPLACRMARAAEAAGSLGGPAGYWRMHDWLMANQKTFSDEALAAAAPGLGFDPAALATAMASPEVAAEIAADAQAAQAVGIRSVPFIVVNNKMLPRWRLEGLLEQVIEAASSLPPTPPRP